MKRHPNKHAEGTRKRWRDAVSEAERKRYEGVWAANRGLLMGAVAPAAATAAAGAGPGGEDGPAARVHALVVRDVWARSGLSDRLLAEVWELVRGGGPAAVAREEKLRGEDEAWRRRSLRREEFVVGMWLVDQCLKGRKLPVEVSESVWGSVRSLIRGLAVR